ncbi:pentatricopeptide repeat-containing protein At1g10910, chloroplastic isoform X3 [Prunus dulcis]|uniref:pentatricopeptide repeat-containing protein At1g10910, chloroplastic isoform X3 n=1 Tax=Prunus dulcis TaxID=3755 RepID=UPI0014825345|nr:pentatricopeptide repeat-containing protein At1g10910, chloroplastic isoform X3 [Prunus dulcis]
MEVSSVRGVGVQHVLCGPSPISSLSILSATPWRSTRAKNSHLCCATTLVKERHTEPPNDGSGIPKRHSKQYLARQSAILEVQESSDLDLALTRLGGSLKVQDLNAIIRHFGILKRWHDLSQLFEWMQQNGKISASSYSSYIKFMGTSLNPVKALEIYNNIQDASTKKNVHICNSVLGSLIRSGKFDGSFKLFHQMKQDGLTPDAVTYSTVILTTLLKVYVRGGLFEKSRELLAELEALGYAEDEMPYCLLMDALAKAGRIHEAKLVFDEMKEKSIRSNGYSYSIMISAFCRGGLLEDAKQLAKDVERTHDKFDLVMLNTMICAYCRAGEMDSVMEMMRKMDELKITPDYNTFHILIKYFCKEKLYLLAYQTMEDMHNKGHQPDEELCSSLMFLLGKIRAYSEAYSVYNILRYSKRTMCKALHEKILHILLAGQLLKDAYVVVKDNAGLISKPAVKKFSTAFLKLGNINLINDVLKVIDASGCKIDQGVFQMAISRYIALPEKKELLIQMLLWMPGQGYVVDSATRNLILKNSHLFGRQHIADVLSKQHMISKASKSRKKDNLV